MDNPDIPVVELMDNYIKGPDFPTGGIILGRAESYASKNPVLPSVFDGIGMGLGFTAGLTSIGIVRELIGSGKIFNFQVLPDTYEPITIFILAPGAFLFLRVLTALQNKIKNVHRQKENR